MISFGVCVLATALFYLGVMPKIAERRDSRFWKNFGNVMIFVFMVALPIVAAGFSIYLMATGRGVWLPILGLILNGGPLLLLLLMTGITR